MSPGRSSLALAALTLLLAAGCGGGASTGETGGSTVSPPPGASAQECTSAPIGVSELRITEGDCETARSVASAWLKASSCAAPAHASRQSCRVGGWLCLGLSAERGIAVGCARPGRSIAFLAAPRRSPAA
jgi:hypothetical protein